MSVKIVTFTSELMSRARAVGEARKNGDEKEFARAQERLKEYERLCSKSDEMILGLNQEDLG